MTKPTLDLNKIMKRQAQRHVEEMDKEDKLMEVLGMTEPTDEELLQWMDKQITSCEYDLASSPNNKYYSKIIAHLKAIRERLLATQWRDIKDAPRDGTNCLLWKSGHHYMGAYDGEYWWVEGNQITAEPTHFMPLPQPPEEK